MACYSLEFCAKFLSKGSIFYSQLIVALVALMFGFLLFWRPKKGIEMQIAFYRLINWKIEPISMEKEIKDTRIMGIALVLASIFLFTYMLGGRF